MGASIRATRAGTGKVAAIKRRAAHPEPTLWRSIGAYLARVNARQFVTEGAYSGQKWRPLKPEYAKWKITHGYGRKILVRTGALRTSYTSRPMAIERYSSSGGQFAWQYGSDIRYAKYHHYGTRYMPARKVIVKTEKMESDLAAIVREYLLTGRPGGAKRV